MEHDDWKPSEVRPIYVILRWVIGLVVLMNYHADPLVYVMAQGCGVCAPHLTDDYGNDIRATNAWRQNSAVTVNINPYWSQPMRTCIERAFSNMNASGNSGVRFVRFTYNTTPPSAENTVQVNQQTPTSGQAEVFLTPRSDGTGLSRAVIMVDPRVTDCEALTQAMAHEIGHTLGLGDCGTCCAGTTVMTTFSGPIDYNDTTLGRSSPGPCDDDSINTDPRYNPNNVNPPPPNPPAAGGGSSSNYNRGDWHGGGCYQWFNVTVYYTCSASGCVVSGVNYTPASGVFCF